MKAQELLNRLNTMVEENSDIADWDIVMGHPFLSGTRLGVVFQLDARRSQLLVDVDPEEIFRPENGGTSTRESR